MEENVKNWNKIVFLQLLNGIPGFYDQVLNKI